MSKKHIVEQYIDGFRTGSQAKVLACLSNNVVWRLHGCQTLIGKAAVEADITNEEFNNTPTLEIHQLIEEGTRVVAVGSGAIIKPSGKTRAFVFSEVFLFDANAICEIDTFHIWTEDDA